jgi:hypothetical protein
MASFRPGIIRPPQLANDGVDTRALQHFLGHRNIMHTVKYTELLGGSFQRLLERLSGYLGSRTSTYSPQRPHSPHCPSCLQRPAIVP